MGKTMTVLPSTGYLLDLGEGLAGALHSGGQVTITDAAGAAVELTPGQVERLAELLALGGALRSQARRRRARAAYLATYAEP